MTLSLTSKSFNKARKDDNSRRSVKELVMIGLVRHMEPERDENGEPVEPKPKRLMTEAEKIAKAQSDRERTDLYVNAQVWLGHDRGSIMRVLLSEDDLNEIYKNQSDAMSAKERKNLLAGIKALQIQRRKYLGKGYENDDIQDVSLDKYPNYAKIMDNKPRRFKPGREASINARNRELAASVTVESDNKKAVLREEATPAAHLELTPAGAT